MKWLLVLFATYMLLLPCIPCNAAEACCVEEKATSDCASREMPCEDEHDTSGGVPCEDEQDTLGEAPCQHERNGTPEEQTHHEHPPVCPCCPSFSCNTCHSLVISAHFMLEEPGAPVLNFDNASFADDLLANFSALIWQPPRCL